MNSYYGTLGIPLTMQIDALRSQLDLKTIELQSVHTAFDAVARELETLREENAELRCRLDELQ